MYKLYLGKAEEQEIKLPSSIGSSKKQENSRKTSTSASDYVKAFDYVDHNNCGKFLKRQEYQTTLPISRETCMQVKKQHLELDMEQRTVSKSGKEYVKAVHCPPVYLIFMQSTSYEILGWMKHKLESRLPGEMSITSNMQMTPPIWQKRKRN